MSNTERFAYDNRIVLYFLIATVGWGVVGTLVGLIIALQLVIPELNVTEYMTFGRMRALHTNAVIFAFVGNAMFAGVYHSLQRLCKAPMFSRGLSWFHFWGWQTIIALTAVTYLAGIMTSHEYAEHEWPIDILITVVWVVFGVNMFGTILKRRVSHLYVAIWFYIATWVTVAMLHIVNSIQIPVSFTKSYYLFAGMQDALVQWWYGHNAVAFFLTTPFLGLMYYYLPKAANRPVYSYRLSIIHFWSLIFLYIWAGPHHLLYTSLPDWAQSLGTVFSIMLIAPSWGGMLNGLLTLRGAWDKVREDTVLKFFAVGITAYGMATFEGPMLSLKSFNAFTHFTDWIVAHVHVGGLGWNGFMIFGMLYWLWPRLFRTTIFSKRLLNTHFWLGTLGIIVYVVPLYWAGFTQGLMWKEFTPEGLLKYPNFLQTVLELKPMYAMRAVGGSLYIVGMYLMVYNLWMTAKQGRFLAYEETEAPPLERHIAPARGRLDWHRWIEARPVPFLVLSFLAVVIGSVAELIPSMVIRSNVPTIASVKPYTPLEVHGRDIYIKEGCNACHTQMVRPFRSETARYGEYSKAGEFVYDHPFLWGSKRTGPDLHREGGRNSNAWHFNHMYDPRSMSPNSIMPPYPHTLENTYDTTLTLAKIKALRFVGVPYAEGFEYKANADVRKQAQTIVDDLQKNNIRTAPDKEIVALIAYLQRLGTDIKVKTADAK